MDRLTDTELTALEQLEESLWRAQTRFDLSYMEQILAADFFEFGRSGQIYQRAQTLAVELIPFQTRFPLPDFKACLIAPDVALVTYQSEVTFGDLVEHANRRLALVKGRRQLENPLSSGHSSAGQRLRSMCILAAALGHARSGADHIDRLPRDARYSLGSPVCSSGFLARQKFAGGRKNRPHVSMAQTVPATIPPGPYAALAVPILGSSSPLA